MRRYSMKSHNRKNHQRWLNQFIRAWNKSVEEDDLWLGRFVIEQKGTEMKWFEDSSGGILYCHLTFRDKKTGLVRDWYTDCLEINWHMWEKLNEFITVDCDVWSKEKPYQERKDCRNVP